MIDIHTHILPRMDDGARDTKAATELMKILELDNISDVVLTPHFYSDSERLEEFVTRRDKKYEDFKRAYSGKVKLHLGAEVYLTKYMMNYSDVSQICIDKTSYMLVELPFHDHLSEETYEVIESLIYDHKVRPIIAHIERYPFIHLEDSVELIEKLRVLGCLIQVNADSIVNKKSAKFVLSLIEKGLVDFLGSDTHDLKNRPPRYLKAAEIVRSSLGDECADRLVSFEEITGK